MKPIRFGTDGWRAIIAEDYTVDNVKRVAYATAQWIKNQSDKPSVVLGYDCRFGGYMFCEHIIDVMLHEKVHVYFDRNFVTTPMVSLACYKLQATAGIIITASHNPPSYNGFKLKSTFGGPTIPKEIAKVETLIPDSLVEVPRQSMEKAAQNNQLTILSMEDMYVEHVRTHFDIEAIKNSPYKLAYDAMYGAGQRVLPRILPNAETLHCEYNPGFYGQAPEPIHKNLTEFSQFIQNRSDISIGLANDGDADRIGLYNSKGAFIDAHHIIFLLIHILKKYKKLDGAIIVAFSVSNRIKKLCEHYGLAYTITKIGFKYIAEIMISGNVLLGGEESGGIAVAGHIPERDGIWDGLVILEHMAKSGKSLEELIDEVYEITGPFSYNRLDLKLSEELKQQVIEHCTQEKYTRFGDFEIKGIETIDGFKYDLGNDRYVMIRPSGTEPVLRVYCEAENMDIVNKILGQVKNDLLNESKTFQ